MSAARRLLRLDGDLSLLAGAAAVLAAGPIGDALDASTGAVRIVGVALLVLGVDALATASLPERLLRPAITAFAIARELAFAGLLAYGLSGGLQLADAAVALLLAESALLGLLHLRAVRMRGQTPDSHRAALAAS